MALNTICSQTKLQKYPCSLRACPQKFSYDCFLSGTWFTKATKSMSTENSTLWKNWKRLQFTANITGLENIANTYLCLFTNELKRHFEHAKFQTSFLVLKQESNFLKFSLAYEGELGCQEPQRLTMGCTNLGRNNPRDQ